MGIYGGPAMTDFAGRIEDLHLLRMWDGVLRELGCSADQIRELYETPGKSAMGIAEDLEESRQSLEQEAQDEARDVGEQIPN